MLNFYLNIKTIKKFVQILNWSVYEFKQIYKNGVHNRN